MAPFYYYRDKDKKEVDLLIVQGGVVYPLKLKKTASPGKDAIRHFQVLEKLKLPIGTGGVVCLAEQALPLTETAQSIRSERKDIREKLNGSAGALAIGKASSFALF